MVSGTVTGFGSVIVDGKRVDDRNVVAGVEREDGRIEAAELKVGQHVDVAHDGNLVATEIRIRSAVEGTVDAVNLATSSLTVMGQTVVVNTDAALGPVTVFVQPYTTLADVLVKDVIEVHALLKTDAAGKTVMQATRIQKKNADAYNRVKGVVKNLTTTTFVLGDLTVDYSSAKVLPAATALANGVQVHVSIPVGTVTPGVAVKATVVKVRDPKSENGDKEAEFGGVASKLDATLKTFVVDGRTVDASTAQFNPAGSTFADLKEGTYVRINGNFKADGTVLAKIVVLRSAEAGNNQGVELHGTVMNFKSMQDFTLRGISINAGTATMDAASCGAITTLADGMQIELRGSLTATGKVTATRIQCEKQQDRVSVVERKGTVSKVDAVAKTFALTSTKETTTVQWSASTLFARVDVTALDGKSLEVEGRMVGGVLQASKVSPD
ncbi:MAG: hypothetical protein HYX43_20740 [Burkholderiales bacterium]|nr:hypothetical protein [Burkholderiales bacterium]